MFYVYSFIDFRVGMDQFILILGNSFFCLFGATTLRLCQ
jgi:hypothetical protein